MMRCTSFSFVLLALALTSICAADEVLFRDNFSGKLGDGWTWVREEKSAWRATDKGLELRVLPGNLWGPANDARNVLVRPAPDTTHGEVEVSAAVTNRPSHQFDQANLAWYFDDSNMVKLGLELVSGEVCIVMGREEGDKTHSSGEDSHPRDFRAAAVACHRQQDSWPIPSGRNGPVA